jgi:hypothetical protein
VYEIRLRQKHSIICIQHVTLLNNSEEIGFRLAICFRSGKLLKREKIVMRKYKTKTALWVFEKVCSRRALNQNDHA